jgi:hypothetical protein
MRFDAPFASWKIFRYEKGLLLYGVTVWQDALGGCVLRETIRRKAAGVFYTKRANC